MNLLGECRQTGKASNAELVDFCLVLRARVLAYAGDREAANVILADLTRRSKSDVYSARWGLNFKEEENPNNHAEIEEHEKRHE